MTQGAAGVSSSGWAQPQVGAGGQADSSCHAPQRCLAPLTHAASRLNAQWQLSAQKGPLRAFGSKGAAVSRTRILHSSRQVQPRSVPERWLRRLAADAQEGRRLTSELAMLMRSDFYAHCTSGLAVQRDLAGLTLNFSLEVAQVY